jgi:hypothetical protein
LAFHICGVGIPQTIFFMKALNNELVTFMIRILYGRFVDHIMNTHRRWPSHLHDVDSI